MPLDGLESKILFLKKVEDIVLLHQFQRFWVISKTRVGYVNFLYKPHSKKCLLQKGLIIPIFLNSFQSWKVLAIAKVALPLWSRPFLQSKSVCKHFWTGLWKQNLLKNCCSAQKLFSQNFWTQKFFRRMSELEMQKIFGFIEIVLQNYCIA